MLSEYIDTIVLGFILVGVLLAWMGSQAQGD